MNAKLRSKKIFRFNEPATYQIKIVGELQKDWSDSLKGMQIISNKENYQNPISVLTGQMSGRSELLAVLHTLYELHLMVLSVKRLK